VPTYEYSCANCGAAHEVVQKMSDDALTICPDCGEPALRKQFTNVGVMFKGSGFYRNDSRSKSSSTDSGSSAAAPAPSSAPSTPAGSSSTSSSSSSSASSD
jgi:putative FmdB family regulatory protein